MAVKKGMEHKEKQRFNHDANIAAAAVGEKAHDGMNQCWTVKKSSL